MAAAPAPEQGFQNFSAPFRSWPVSFYGSDSGSFWFKFCWFRLCYELKFAISH